ncbi:MAG: CotH kinase family protein, partial [Gemmataceae bacterium]
MNTAWLVALSLLCTAPPDKAGSSLLGLDRLNALQVELEAKQFARMQPPQPRFPSPPGFPGFPGPVGPPAPVERPPVNDVHRNTFGVELLWVHGKLRWKEQTFDSVGVRYKGNYTLLAATGLKKSLKVDLNRYVPKQNLDGLKMLNLNNGVSDPFKIREAVTYAFFREAGLIAPRTGFVEVTLQVPGQHEKRLLGLYTLVEAVDKEFLKRHFKEGKGMLLKPEGLANGLTYLGSGWSAYEKMYRPKDEPSDAHKQRLIDFTRLIDRENDAQFERQIESFLDVDMFLRYVAANALIANMDSYLGLGHNFYLYLVPRTNRFVMLPWDCDLSFGAWPVAGTPEQQVELSLHKPWVGKNRLLERLFAVPRFKKRYLELVTELTKQSFTQAALGKQLDQAEATIKDALARDKKAQAAGREAKPGAFASGAFAPGGPAMAGTFGAALPPRSFIRRRVESVREQLAGKRKGYEPKGLGGADF